MAYTSEFFFKKRVFSYLNKDVFQHFTVTVVQVGQNITSFNMWSVNYFNSMLVYTIPFFVFLNKSTPWELIENTKHAYLLNPFCCGSKTLTKRNHKNDFPCIKHTQNNSAKSLYENKRFMGHFVHMSNNSHNKITFLESFTKYLDRVDEKIFV